MTSISKMVLAALALFVVQVADPAIAGEDVDQDEPTGVTESRVLVQSDVLYRATQNALVQARLADVVVSEVHYPEGWDWQTQGSLIEAQKNWIGSKSNRVQPKDITYPDPIIPSGNPPMGTKQTTSDSCVMRRHGPGIGDVSYGSATWHWEYGYRVDSDGDGKKDSDPGWYLTKEEFSVYQETQAGQIQC